VNKAEFIAAVKRLALDPDSFIVVGSGILAALEIRQSPDVDIIVNKDTL